MTQNIPTQPHKLQVVIDNRAPAGVAYSNYYGIAYSIYYGVAFSNYTILWLLFLVTGATVHQV
jgi:hypothetical protein